MQYFPIQFSESAKDVFKIKGLQEKFRKSGNENFTKLVNRLVDNEDIDDGYNMIFCIVQLVHLYDGNATLEDDYDKETFYRKMESFLIGNVPEIVPFAGKIKFFIDRLFLSVVMTKWDKHKLVYKVNTEMQKALCTMDIPKDIKAGDLLKAPADVFCVDFDKGLIVDTRYKCMFVSTSVGTGENNNRLRVQLILCRSIDFDEIDNTLGFYMEIGLGNDMQNSMSEIYDKYCKGREDKDTLQCAMTKFFINLIAYMNACNNDIQYSERTKSVYKPREKSATPKPKIREVEELEVGYRYAEDIKPGRVRYKYIKGDADTKREEPKVKRGYSSCFRSAHWHTYWIGHGDDKKKELKFLSGTFVKGSKPAKAVIHNVKLK